MKEITIITEKEYCEDIIKYYKKYEGKDLRVYLFPNPTPAGITKACVEILKKESVKKEDQTVVKKFLEQQQDVPGLFKSVQKFLKGETESISLDKLELIAILIDCPLRNFRTYRQACIRGDKNKILWKGMKTPPEGESEPPPIGRPKIRIKIILGIASLILILVALWKGLYHSKSCMVWMDTHYEKVDCDVVLERDFKVSPVAYDRKKFRTLKRIQTDRWDTVSFFKEGSPNVWYVKTGNRLEFFRADYPHPVTGKALREVSRYIIDKYVFTSIEKHLRKEQDSIRK